MAPYIDKLWVYILDLLKKNRMEEDTMAIYGGEGGKGWCKVGFDPGRREEGRT